MNDIDAQQILEAYTATVKEEPGNSLDDWNDRRQAEDNKPRVGAEATGDPSTFQVGQILRSSQTGDGFDGMIINISEEDGELSFDLIEIGPEGWTVRASDIKPSTNDKIGSGPSTQDYNDIARGRPTSWSQGKK